MSARAPGTSSHLPPLFLGGRLQHEESDDDDDADVGASIFYPLSGPAYWGLDRRKNATTSPSPIATSICSFSTEHWAHAFASSMLNGAEDMPNPALQLGAYYEYHGAGGPLQKLPMSARDFCTFVRNSFIDINKQTLNLSWVEPRLMKQEDDGAWTLFDPWNLTAKDFYFAIGPLEYDDQTTNHLRRVIGEEKQLRLVIATNQATLGDGEDNAPKGMFSHCGPDVAMGERRAAKQAGAEYERVLLSTKDIQEGQVALLFTGEFVSRETTQFVAAVDAKYITSETGGSGRWCHKDNVVQCAGYERSAVSPGEDLRKHARNFPSGVGQSESAALIMSLAAKCGNLPKTDIERVINGVKGTGFGSDKKIFSRVSLAQHPAFLYYAQQLHGRLAFRFHEDCVGASLATDFFKLEACCKQSWDEYHQEVSQERKAEREAAVALEYGMQMALRELKRGSTLEDFDDIVHRNMQTFARSSKGRDSSSWEVHDFCDRAADKFWRLARSAASAVVDTGDEPHIAHRDKLDSTFPFGANDTCMSDVMQSPATYMGLREASVPKFGHKTRGQKPLFSEEMFDKVRELQAELAKNHKLNAHFGDRDARQLYVLARDRGTLEKVEEFEEEAADFYSRLPMLLHSPNPAYQVLPKVYVMASFGATKELAEKNENVHKELREAMVARMLDMPDLKDARKGDNTSLLGRCLREYANTFHAETIAIAVANAAAAKQEARDSAAAAKQEARDAAAAEKQEARDEAAVKKALEGLLNQVVRDAAAAEKQEARDSAAAAKQEARDAAVKKQVEKALERLLNQVVRDATAKRKAAGRTPLPKKPKPPAVVGAGAAASTTREDFLIPVDVAQEFLHFVVAQTERHAHLVLRPLLKAQVLQYLRFTRTATSALTGPTKPTFTNSVMHTLVCMPRLSCQPDPTNTRKGVSIAARSFTEREDSVYYGVRDIHVGSALPSATDGLVDVGALCVRGRLDPPSSPPPRYSFPEASFFPSGPEDDGKIPINCNVLTGLIPFHLLEDKVRNVLDKKFKTVIHRLRNGTADVSRVLSEESKHIYLLCFAVVANRVIPAGAELTIAQTTSFAHRTHDEKQSGARPPKNGAPAKSRSGKRSIPSVAGVSVGAGFEVESESDDTDLEESPPPPEVEESEGSEGSDVQEEFLREMETPPEVEESEGSDVQEEFSCDRVLASQRAVKAKGIEDLATYPITSIVNPANQATVDPDTNSVGKKILWEAGANRQLYKLSDAGADTSRGAQTMAAEKKTYGTDWFNSKNSCLSRAFPTEQSVDDMISVGKRVMETINGAARDCDARNRCTGAQLRVLQTLPLVALVPTYNKDPREVRGYNLVIPEQGLLRRSPANSSGNGKDMFDAVLRADKDDDETKQFDQLVDALQENTLTDDQAAAYTYRLREYLELARDSTVTAAATSASQSPPTC
jgi:hypothetical protein